MLSEKSLEKNSRVEKKIYFSYCSVHPVSECFELPWFVFKTKVSSFNIQKPSASFSKVIQSFKIKCIMLYSDGEVQFA